LAQSPFIPFIILFCHIVETFEASDLEHMRRLVETLESTSDDHGYNTCDRQRRLFKVLYEVAAKYIEVQSWTGGGRMSWATAEQQYTNALASATPSVFGLGTASHPGGFVGDMATAMPAAGDALPSHIPSSHAEANGIAAGVADDLEFREADMEMDLSGAELWDWFSKNQSIMRMLEDT
jgi:hypothetical protein